MKDKLIIIGNGFDLAHGYHTSYKAFAGSGKSECLSTFYRLSRKYCALQQPDEHWYDFERMIDAMTSSWFQSSFASFIKESNQETGYYEADLKAINRAFSTIAEELMQFLQQETAEKKPLIPAIEAEIDDHSHVVSFNYTDVATYYGQSVYYIHGSIAEGSIVLGYPPRQDPDFMDMSATRFAKEQLRELLNFQRYLRSRHIDPTSSDGKDFVEQMREQIQSRFSLRGEYSVGSAVDELPDMIRDYGVQNHFSSAPLDYGVELSQIKTLVIMGHSLKADEDIFNDLVNRMSSLMQIKIYTYAGEPTAEINEKAAFFKPVGVPIVIESYRR